MYLCTVVQEVFKKPQALLSKVLLKQQQCSVFSSFQELQECVLAGTTRKHCTGATCRRSCKGSVF